MTSITTPFKKLFSIVVIALFASPLQAAVGASGAAVFSRVCSPEDTYFSTAEQPFRSSLCLNGRWNFEPVPVPSTYQPDAGNAPALPMPTGNWSAVPIKIPSPINVNSWGNGRDVGDGTASPYSASSVYYPSYPPEWDHAQMGWMERKFLVPSGWAGRKLLLHFDAVAGSCSVIVNGHQFADHFDSFLPFDIDITDFVQQHGSNELLVGVRAANLFNDRSSKYPEYIRPYPNGSSLDSIVGIWQDVTLIALPAIRVTDTFVQPLVSRRYLNILTTLRNDTNHAVRTAVGVTIHPWINLAGDSVVTAPEPKWRLAQTVLAVPSRFVSIPANSSVSVTLSVNVGTQLKAWTPSTPNLYGLVVTLSSNNRPIDTKYTRFGWRELTINGRTLLLNGKKIQLVGDICHPFGPCMMSRRYAWAWFHMIKDYGGNAVRLHAQPWPPFFLDMADEMGIMVLDEDALFGSSISLNLDSGTAWERYNAHLSSLILRDRNHPSVFGWSFGNEMFAVLGKADAADAADYRAKLVELGRSALALDPTRPWISCDGDQDLDGSLPTWSRHLGLGLHLDQLPPASINKPLMVGESGGTYYARPSEMAVFNGDNAYQSYAGRNDALGIDLYQNVFQMARPYLAYFSASETVWFGLEHLNFGYSDYRRLPNVTDGIFFGPYIEGQRGMQLERIPPYVATLNPGWDPALPLYKPLGMFNAFKAAMHQPKPLNCKWDHVVKQKSLPSPPIPTIGTVSFAGGSDSILFNQLSTLGVPLADSSSNMLIVDGQGLTSTSIASVKALADTTTAQGGTVLIMVRNSSAPINLINQLLPFSATLTDRSSTQLDCSASSSMTDSLSMTDRYFAEDSIDPHIQKCGIGGTLVNEGTILLSASNTDWSFFVNSGEISKCGAEVLYEHLVKPSGAAMVSVRSGKGTVILSSLDYSPLSQNYVRFWRKLLANAGVILGKVKQPWLLIPGGYATPAPSWQYTLVQPSNNWTDTQFDDSAWSSGLSGFGTTDPGVEPNTRWQSDDIWLRTKFNCSAESLKGINLVLYHDEDIDVFVNGQAIYHEGGFITQYETIKLPPTALTAFHIGENVVAVHCHQTAGGQYIDVGFASGQVVQNGSKPVGHDLLLNGPQQ